MLLRHSTIYMFPLDGGGAGFRSSILPPQQADKTARFKRWLDLFFIKNGYFRVTNKGYDELTQQTLRRNLEFGEPACNRTGELRLDPMRPMTNGEIREAINIEIGRLVADGKTEELYDQGIINRPERLSWKDHEMRKTTIKELYLTLGKDKKEISKHDFYEYGLRGLLKGRYSDSPYLALVEAGYAYSFEELMEHANHSRFGTDKIYPWELTRVPFMWSDKEIRVATVKWLVWTTGKNARDISGNDFSTNGLDGLLDHHYMGSPYMAVLEAGLVTEADEEHMRSRGQYGHEGRITV